MNISFHGAAGETTGSKHVIEVNGKRVLLECGLFHGRRKETEHKNRNIPFDPKSIDAMILSHAHIDHSGNIPTLVSQGYEGNIFATPATRDLCSIMLRDSAHIHEKDVEYVNKKHAKRGEPPVEPLYTMEEAVQSMRNFVSVAYDRWFFVTNGVKAVFRDAGHILGSATVTLELRHNDETRTLLFTGDLGRKNLPILRDPVQVTDVDYVVCESTYGGRFHAPIQDMENELAEVISRTAGRGGKVIIPAFSVGRTQNIVYSLHNLFNEGRLTSIPIFVDSPLSTNVTEIFKIHPECYDREAIEMAKDDPDIFGFGRLEYTPDVQDSKKLNDIRYPCVIISASGMCETGRILHHLKNSITEPRNTVLIVGYQAENTLGRRLVEKHKNVKIFGRPYQVRAEVKVMNGYSAHADSNELAEYVTGVGGKPRGVFLVHGEPVQAEALADKLKTSGITNIHIAERGETVELH
jgi:metallo-beta-lactamase family protein